MTKSAAMLALAIDEVGAQGDGVARTTEGPVYVPFTAPGDRIEATPPSGGADGRRSSLVRLLQPGPARVEPPCPHFGTCGSCALQHLSDGFLADWKRERVVAALRQRGFAEPPVAATRSTPPGTRRRVGLTALSAGGRLLLGFSERAGRRTVDVARCPVMRPELLALLPRLHRFLLGVLRPAERADVQLAWSETGCDLWIVPPRRPDLAQREAAAALADELDLARLSWGAPPEPLAVRRTPLARLGGVAVELPPGAFQQASLEGEAILTGLVTEAVGAAAHVVDLFAGLGTFALPLAAGRRVRAYEGDAVLLQAMARAARREALPGFVAERRDLFRRPLRSEELVDVAAVVVDPPRAGAEAQARCLADSRVPVLAMVSCNPATFARDARILCDGGYRLLEVTPVDQFLWSPHVELVASFARR